MKSRRVTKSSKLRAPTRSREREVLAIDVVRAVVERLLGDDEPLLCLANTLVDFGKPYVCVL
jgi:hypothetical protein